MQTPFSKNRRWRPELNVRMGRGERRWARVDQTSPQKSFAAKEFKCLEIIRSTGPGLEEIRQAKRDLCQELPCASGSARRTLMRKCSVWNPPRFQ